jgi:hypothetical protein
MLRVMFQNHPKTTARKCLFLGDRQLELEAFEKHQFLERG